MSLSDVWGAKEDQWTPADQLRSDIRVGALTCHGRLNELNFDYRELTEWQLKQSLNVNRGCYKAIRDLNLEYFFNRPLNTRRMFDAAKFVMATPLLEHARVAALHFKTEDEYLESMNSEPYDGH